MSGATAGLPSDVAELASREYQYGFVTDLDTDVVPPGLAKTSSLSSPPRRTSQTGCSNGACARTTTG